MSNLRDPNRFNDLNEQILSKINFRSEYESLGVRWSSNAAKEDGWLECHAMDRKDDHPSAAANLKTGRWRDLGNGEDFSFWDFVAKYGNASSWRDARDGYAKKLRIDVPRSKTEQSHDGKIVQKKWNSEIASIFCRRKPGVTEEAILAAGGKLGKHLDYTVIYVPVFGPSLADHGHCMWQACGGMLKYREKLIKTKLAPDSHQGLVGKHGLDRIRSAEVVWITEGPPDLLSLWAAIPAGLRESHVVVTMSNGCKQRADPKLLAILKGKSVRIVFDCDEPGQAGAKAWAEVLRTIAAETKLVTLPYPIEPKHGKDLRDWLNEGHTYDDLLKLAESSDSLEAKPRNLETIDNGIITYAGDEEVIEPKPILSIVEEIHDHVGDWPCRVDNSLFVAEDQAVRWLDNASSLFAWLQQQCGVVLWRQKTGCVAKQELFQHLKGTATHYAAVEALPHEPPIPGHFYLDQEAAGGDGTTFELLLDRFSPETPADRELIRAMFATVFWGGKPGSRPAFVVTSDIGRGAGKSKLTDMLAHLAGGLIELSQNEDAKAMRERLLSPGGMSKRIVRLDNVKTHRLSWADFESLITSAQISGRRMYQGEGSRPNTLTFTLTLNGPSLSTDMAQRCILIKLCRPEYVGDWESETMAFIDANRAAIIGDILAFLRQPAGQILNRMRWASWEREVLSRLDDPQTVQQIIIERAQAADTDADEIGLFEEYLESQLERLGYTAETDKVHIPPDYMQRWWNEVMNENRTTVTVSKIIGQLVDEGGTRRIGKNPSRKFGRGFLWNPEASSNAHYDISSRVEIMQNGPDRGSKWWE